MFGEFLNIVFKSIKLDKTLYSDNRNFGVVYRYFPGFSSKPQYLAVNKILLGIKLKHKNFDKHHWQGKVVEKSQGDN